MIAVPCGTKNQFEEKFHSAYDNGLSGGWGGFLCRDIAGYWNECVVAW